MTIRAGQRTATHVIVPGSTPLIISVPHAGTAIPAELAPLLTPLALSLPDTDWHVAELYDFAPALGATMLIAQYSRYLIDLNRPPDDAALYEATPRTGLCPSASFAGEPLYQSGATALAATDIAERRKQYWQPYHDALRNLIARTRERFGYALLLDAHSIRSVVPRLFEGRLPDINVGTNKGSACTLALTEALRAQLAGQTRWSQVFDGRFTGGYITRHYGQPATNVHSVQLELAQCAYLDEASARYDAARAEPLRDLLRSIVATLVALPIRVV